MANSIILRDEKKNPDINKKRQIPLQSLHDLKSFSKSECDKKLMMVMDLESKGLIFDRELIEGEAFIEFDKKFRLLKPVEIRNSLTVTTSDFQNVLGQTVPCVGCRRSVEKLYKTIMTNGYATLDPIRIKNGKLSVCDKYLQSSQLMCTLLYEHDIQLNELLENQPRNKKNSRCNLHSLESFRPFVRPFSETWYETWECMKKNCREKITTVEANELHATLDEYLKKHKFCQECRTKVEKAYTLLMSEPNPTKEKGYVTAIYNGIKRCLKDTHIHLPTEFDYIDDLIKRAEPEIIGSHSRHRERHAKTMEIAQEEVLTCIGMCIYNRLKRVQQCVKEEENACQVLAAVAVYSLCRSFDMAVEKKRGVNLEFIYNEISRDERNKEQQNKKKKLKKRKKRNEKKNKEEDVDQESSRNCDEIADICSSDENCEEVDTHSDDDDNKDKIILCDGTIIDADINFNISPLMNTNKLSMLTPTITTTIEHDHMHESDTNHNENDEDDEEIEEEEEEEEEEIKNCSRSASIENLETKMDALSVVSCHSCHDDGDGECAQRSIDAGYSSETHHEVLLSNNNSSRTSSIVSTPEGSEVACSHFCCNKNNKENNDTFITLEQMLDEEHSDDNDECFIPESEIIAWEMKFKSRDDIKQKREALREKLLQNFKEMCEKRIQDITKVATATSTVKQVNAH
ncbi:hypothetical protein PVAND_012711 [Polypedilum vanderplanki]|uniref:Gametogenetin-binding protein 2-like n=1 Tax=Polypedilum vanderplanki TaxID=319348 RepID=A0A9J6CPA0_POLVA|nr:hypothetical protein PVAND_012711 [Polypedilum vanderplanki]